MISEPAAGCKNVRSKSVSVRAPVRPSALVREAADSLRLQVEAKRLRLEVDAAPDLAPERPPSMVSKHVLAWENVRFRDSLLHESLEDRAVVHGRLIANRPSKCILLHSFAVDHCWHG